MVTCPTARCLLLFTITVLSGLCHAMPWPIVLQDDNGREVRLRAPAKRIVSLAPHLTELLFEIGAEAQIAGTVAYSDYPQAARTIPRVGDARSVDLERIVSLQPDLVLAWRSGNSRRTIARLRAMGYAVFESEPRRLTDIPATLERLGTLTGTAARAAAQSWDFQRRLALLRNARDGRPLIKVFYQVWYPPLMSVNREHIVSDVLAACGVINVAGNDPRLVPRPSVESIIAANPRAIIVAAAYREDPAVTHWRRWRALSAVEHDRVFVVSPDILHRHTSRILDGISELCGQLALVHS